MKSVLFTMPLKSGKLPAYKAFIDECTTGSKQEEYKDLLLRYGLNSTKMWLQTLDGKDYAMFIHDMDDDGMEKLKAWDASTHPFDQWFNQQLHDCYDFDNKPEQPVFYSQFDARTQMLSLSIPDPEL